MGIDRKIFNVEKNLTSVGGTAVDVMKSVPSVNVDIDGNVTLRNASPQIFVDGRPTTMTLDQIPADAIATVEIITNPSAKFDASGGGSGILNIVLKKNRKAGYNGNVRASIDRRGMPSLGGDINVKQQKVNFFASTQAGIRKSITTANTTRTTFDNTAIAHFTQNNKPVNKGFFSFARMGMDYLMDNRNTLTVGANIVRGQFKTRDQLDIARDTTIGNTTVYDKGTSATYSIGNFRNYGTSLSFKHNFAKAGKEITADVNYNYSKNDNEGDFTSQYFYLNNSPKTPALTNKTDGGGTTKFFTAQSDYSNPITAKIKIEAGARAAIRKYTSFFDTYIKNGNSFLLLPDSNSNYKFSDAVYAGYVTYSQQFKKMTMQLGLRAESFNYEGTLIKKSQLFKTNYPVSFFPSAFFTFNVSAKEDMQLNYSRKINRPNFFQLIPFVDLTDPNNISKGNPGLIPEFTNLVELSYSNQLKAGHSLLTSLYFRNTNDLITRYTYKDKRPDVNTTDSTFFTTFINADRSYTAGLEITLKNKITDWWDLTSNFNFFNSIIKAGQFSGTADNTQFSWFGKLNNSFKLPKNYSVQLSADYQAKTLLNASGAGSGGGGRGMGGMFGGGGGPGMGQTQSGAQGYIKPRYAVDVAFKKEFLKNNAASLTLQFSDIFRTQLSANHSESSYFVQDVQRRRDPQMVRLNFNWRFGKIDVNLFKRKNLKGEMENMQNMQSGMGGN
jgi:outer membrane receptor protein involved in Fe transport